MKFITTTCYFCTETFEKSVSEYNRTERRGSLHFCSLRCSVSYTNFKRTEEECMQIYKTQLASGFDIRNLSGSTRTSLSPFKSFLLRGKGSIRKHGVASDVDCLYLKDLWEAQAGRCSYTGIPMLLPETTSAKYMIRSLRRASLDRIDSSKGYCRGNIEFVCFAINCAKNDFASGEMRLFLQEVALAARNSTFVFPSPPVYDPTSDSVGLDARGNALRVGQVVLVSMSGKVKKGVILKSTCYSYRGKLPYVRIFLRDLETNALLLVPAHKLDSLEALGLKLVDPGRFELPSFTSLPADLHA